MNPTDPNVHPLDIDRLAGQNRTVYDLLADGSILTTRAAYEHGITRLAARVYDLRRHGVDVRSDYCTARKCAVYWIGGRR